MFVRTLRAGFRKYWCVSTEADGLGPICFDTSASGSKLRGKIGFSVYLFGYSKLRVVHAVVTTGWVGAKLDKPASAEIWNDESMWPQCNFPPVLHYSRDLLTLVAVSQLSLCVWDVHFQKISFIWRMQTHEKKKQFRSFLRSHTLFFSTNVIRALLRECSRAIVELSTQRHVDCHIKKIGRRFVPRALTRPHSMRSITSQSFVLIDLLLGRRSDVSAPYCFTSGCLLYT